MKSDALTSSIVIDHFRHAINGRVKTFEVDRQNIVHNIIYMYWLEHARVEYVRSLGIEIKPSTFIDSYTFVVAKTEVNYLAPALFDQAYTVFTRIPSIGITSLIFEQVIQSEKDATTLLFASSVLVQLDPKSKEPTPISKQFRDMVASYETQSTVKGV
ncbi:MAG: acyl-CoA thioesterase [Ignavibacteria bacterium]|nr:acyl-CoA thioesterase [Ignavibacteria bacterium]